MSSATDYQFARCKVLGHAREVWLDDELQDVPPRVFDLLLYLLKHRDRVVSKDEILQEIWLGRTVTDNVVSRAIMIARTVIGDSKGHPTLIKTLQRVGYRFIGDMLDSNGRVDAGTKAANRRASQLGIRLALLPLANQTGQAELAWVELGLPSLVTQTIGSDTGVELIATSAVLTALEDRPPHLAGPDIAQHVLRGLGATLLIETRVTKDHQGYRLEYLAHGKHAMGFAGALQGDQLTSLAQGLARAIRYQLLGEKGNSNPLESADPFVNECFSRGMQALNQQQFAKAVDLLRVVAHLEPDNVALGLTYLTALQPAGHPDTIKLAEQMIERGRETGDSYVENSARKILARALFEDKRDVAAADRVLDEMLAAEPPDPIQSWYIEALMMRGRIRLEQGDRIAARAITNRVLTLCDETDNHIIRAWALNNRATIEAKEGYLWQARETFREVCELLTRMQRNSDCARAQSNLAITDFNLGLIDEAVSEMYGAMKAMQNIAAVPQKLPNAIMSAAMLFAQVHDSAKLAELMHCLQHGAWSETVASSDFLPHVVGAYQSYCSGDLKACADLYWLAVETAIAKAKGRTPKMQSWLPMAIMHLTLGRRYDQVEAAASFFNPETEKLFPWAPSMMLHANAIEAFQRGDHVRARHLLQSALAKAKGGLTEALIRIDLAWVLLCNDEVEPARSLCSPIQPFLTQHPAGLVVHALLQSRAGLADEASRSLQAHLKLVGRPSRSAFAGLANQLSCAKAATHRLDLSAYLQFPTTYLVQKPFAEPGLRAPEARQEQQQHYSEAMSK
jgi:DNA-binding winged helix-turn-helix (wHTH) protein/tetratricopeptide (TPR) repeat protein